MGEINQSVLSDRLGYTCCCGSVAETGSRGAHATEVNSLEVRIGFHTDFRYIKAAILIFFADTDANGVFQNQPDNGRRNHDKSTCSGDTNELSDEACFTVSERYSHSSPYTGNEMD